MLNKNKNNQVLICGGFTGRFLRISRKITSSLFPISFLLSISTMPLAQTQLGTDIDGEAAGDLSGITVSMSSDGDRMAIGAIRNDGNGTNSGHVRVYQWSGSTWVQLGADIDGEAADDGSGRSVSLSSDGNRLAIGAPANVHNGIVSGHVRVYQWSGSAWVQLGLDIDGEAADDRFGWSNSLSSDGNRLAVGAYIADGNGIDSGHVRVYQWSGSAWTQLGTDIDGEAADDRSGYSVSLSSDGNRLAIGAPRNGDNVTYSSQMRKSQNNSGQAVQNQNDAGHVRVYQWSGTTWTQLGNDIDGESAEDNSGTSVSLSADGVRLAIGAADNAGNGNNSGHVRVYHWSGTDWAQLGEDIDGEAARDFSGVRVSLTSDGNRLAIGAIGGNDDNGISSGHVRVYQWSGSKWVQLGIDIDGEAVGDNFGESVSWSSGGNRLAIGAPVNGGNGEGSGHVRVYDLSMFNVFQINAGLNDAWYNPLTSGQGFFVTVFPDIKKVFLAWFTFDTELPPMDATANLGYAGHRWLTAIGSYVDNEVVMNISITTDGIFDNEAEVQNTDPPGSDGTIILTFENCSTGTVEYDIPSINRQGIVPIQRIANDNAALCEAIRAELQNLR